MFVTKCLWKIDHRVGCWPSAHQEGAPLPTMLQRRLTPLGKSAMEALFKCADSSDAKTIQWVTSCRHGDSQRMVQLLGSLAQGETISPTDFSLSVHNAVVGQFSIETKNKRSNTSLSGGIDSFEAGLLEAFALQADSQQPVGYIYYERPLPELYQDRVHEDFSEVIMLMILESEDKSGKALTLTHGRDKEVKAIDPLEKKGLLTSLVEFLNDDKQNFKIHIPGGHLLLERP